MTSKQYEQLGRVAAEWLEARADMDEVVAHHGHGSASHLDILFRVLRAIKNMECIYAAATLPRETLAQEQRMRDYYLTRTDDDGQVTHEVVVAAYMDSGHGGCIVFYRGQVAHGVEERMVDDVFEIHPPLGPHDRVSLNPSTETT